jgi:hypothetical protein
MAQPGGRAKTAAEAKVHDLQGHERYRCRECEAFQQVIATYIRRSKQTILNPPHAIEDLMIVLHSQGDAKLLHCFTKESFTFPRIFQTPSCFRYFIKDSLKKNFTYSLSSIYAFSYAIYCFQS